MKRAPASDTDRHVFALHAHRVFDIVAARFALVRLHQRTQKLRRLGCDFRLGLAFVIRFQVGEPRFETELERALAAARAAARNAVDNPVDAVFVVLDWTQKLIASG